jgi:penicillin-binding protein 2B
MTLTMNQRIKYVILCFAFLFVCVIVRIFWLQVVMADDLLAEKSETQTPLEAKRGTIYDRNGKVMAFDAPSYTLAIKPRDAHQYRAVDLLVQKLAPVLGIDAQRLRQMFNKKYENGKYAKHVEVRPEGYKLDFTKSDKIKTIIDEVRTEIDDPAFLGAELVKTYRRYYPNGSEAAHVLGYYSTSGYPDGGVELQYDRLLRGKDGQKWTEQFAENRLENRGVIGYQPVVDGKSVKLTIDMNIQHYLESAMDQVVFEFKPKALMAVITDPLTNEVLALANRPTFDPNRYSDPKYKDAFFNHVIGSQYEPGSTYKLVTLGGAVQEGLFEPDAEKAKFMSGQIKRAGRTIHDHDRKGWGEIGFLEGLYRSSNVGFVTLGYDMLGKERFKTYSEKFGFGKKTGIDLPAETAGRLSFRQEIDYVVGTYGQGGVLTTTMQQAAAYGAVANGGQLLKPFVLKEVLDYEGRKVLSRTKPTVVRRVLTEQATAETTQHLVQVIEAEKGTGKRARIEGYTMAGKTGTANKVENGGYASNKWVISFSGYGPVKNPRILISIVADFPDLGGNYKRGGEVALPMFREVAYDTLRYLNVPFDTETERVVAAADVPTMPDLQGLTSEQAKDALERRGLAIEWLGSGPKVLAHYPNFGQPLHFNETAYVLTEPGANVKLPDVRGKSKRELLQLCKLLAKACRVEGEGYVVKQTLISEFGKPISKFMLMPPPEDRLMTVALRKAAEQASATQAPPEAPPQTATQAPTQTPTQQALAPQ